MATATIAWDGTITAVSSIAHGGETRGTIKMLRREGVRQSDGSLLYVPVISGNAFRARLRRIGEELLRDTLLYEGRLPRSVAVALRGGGTLARVAGEPLSGRRLKTLRQLVPQIGVFGGVGGGTIIEGCLKVGKVQPHLAETAHVTGVESDLSVFDATQLEQYARGDDTDAHSLLGPPRHHGIQLAADGQPDLVEAESDGDSSLMQYAIETFPAGTTFSTWLRLDRATELEVSFFTDVLDTFSRSGWLGGRSAVGHGQVRLALTSRLLAGQSPSAPVDWRDAVSGWRDEALEALEVLT